MGGGGRANKKDAAEDEGEGKDEDESVRRDGGGYTRRKHTARGN